MMPPPTGPDLGVVLLVDDAPSNLAMLSDALDEAGYMVLVATDGRGALERIPRIAPDVILLDAVMPGLDGFETCRRIKAHPAGRDIPVIFMTGLTDTEHVVRGFEAGGIDYVTKPIRPDEVVARVAAHVRTARHVRHARTAIEAAGLAVAVLSDDLAPEWMAPAAAALLAGAETGDVAELPPALRAWLGGAAVDDGASAFDFDCAGTALRARLLGRVGRQWLLQLERRAASASPPLLSSFRLTQREMEVLMWVSKGKTNKDIGDILGLSPRTVNKHLEHVFEKLGVETRTAAAAIMAAAAGGD